MKARQKRVLISELQPETVLDLLHCLPKRLLETIVTTHGLKPINSNKDALLLVITENRKTIFRNLKFSFDYIKHEHTPHD